MKPAKSATDELISFFRECYSLMRDKSVNEFSFEKGGMKISIKRSCAAAEAFSERHAPVRAPAGNARPVEVQKPEAAPAEDRAVKTIKSPLAGIFYTAASPNSRPFISPPCNVSKGETLSIVEAMKVMNEIESPSNCRVLRTLAENASLVQKGEDLFEIE